LNCFIKLQIFQEYGDTVVSIGLSHLSLNSGIFGASDLSIGIDVINENASTLVTTGLTGNPDGILPQEIAFVSAVSSHSCAFCLMGSASTSQLPSIIAKGRAALHGAAAGALFMVYGSLSYSFYVLFATFAVSTVVPFVPVLASVLLVLLLLPNIGIAMVMSEPEEGSMEQVPPKNDQSVVFGRKEAWILYSSLIVKAIPVAVFPHLLHLIAFGELAIKFDYIIITELCPSASPGSWVDLVRCEKLRDYSGAARASAGTLAIAELVICLAISSTGFVNRTIPLVPWARNYIWAVSVVVTLAMVAIYLRLTLERGSVSALPWYYFLLAGLMPFLCLGWNEFVKSFEEKHLRRAEKLRRLQFETRCVVELLILSSTIIACMICHIYIMIMITYCYVALLCRLGMWSPK
jgi:magnesium-transporting ATPase (P-type)